MAGWAGPADAQAPDPRNTTRIIDFPDCCPRPAWWDEVEVEARIGSSEEFLAVWQNKALTDRQKAKAMFRAIEEHVRQNDDVTAAAVNYYYWVDRDYPQMRRLYEFGLGYFLDYDRPLENYGGKAGDMTAGMVNNLAKLYMREGLPERAEPWLRYLIEMRGDQVNDHLLETAATHLGDSLIRQGREAEAVEVLLAAKRNYDGDWEKSLDKQLAKAREAMGLSYYLHDTRYAVIAGAGALLLLLVVLLLTRRKTRRVG
jgi:tetratricopeptide (TPR) repeat protein